MPAGILDLYIEQGASFSRLLTIESAPGVPIDITGATVRGQIKTKASDTAPVIAFTCAVSAPLLGQISVNLTATETASIPATGDKYTNLAKYVYDIEMDQAGTVTRLLNGQVTVSPEVTK